MIFLLFENFTITPVVNGTGEAIHFSQETNTVVAHCEMGGMVNAASETGAKLLASGLSE